ncbi:MAG: ribosome maturation factor RimP [Rhodospirillaceae bacterium]|nr:ribosome maturation factor RimP [Rhodospirillaceae bacterium]
MDKTQLIARMIGPSLDAMGYELVRVMVSGQHHMKLQVMVERSDRAGMTVDDCADVSRAVSALLDVEDPIRGPYTLEVSSPGIDRPLTRLGDFDRFAGHLARVETVLPIEGRRRFKGRLIGVEGDRVRLALRGEGGEAAEDIGEVAVPFAAIQKAKLVLTDELIAASGARG